MNAINSHRNQYGAALVIGLILLVVITILAISGMSTATTGLAIARNDQNYENAFQAAESGLDTALATKLFSTLATTTVTYDFPNGHDKVTAQIDFEDTSHVPDKAFSLGVGSGISAFHFLAVSNGESRRDPGNLTDRDSTATHSQAFYVVGPEDSTL